MNLKLSIEAAIVQTLVIQNKQSIPLAVERIASLLNSEQKPQVSDTTEVKSMGEPLAQNNTPVKEDWISVEDRLPEEGGRYWCYIREINDLGISYFQWNCDYHEKERRFSDSALTNGESVTHWRPLLPAPPTNIISKPLK